jgi:hypothetical protein
MNILKPFLVFMLAISFCCKHKDAPKVKGYVYHNHWILKDHSSDRPFVGEPKEIKETNYDNLEDTSLDVPGPKLDYDLYRFDKEGNMIFSSYSIYGKTTDVKLTYGPEGPGMHITTSGKTSSVITKKIGENKYKATQFREGPYEQYYIESFSPDGQTVTQEIWINNKLELSLTRHYEKDKLVKQEIREEKKISSGELFYSDKGFLDSILVFDEDKPNGKSVFINNEQGDAVLYIKYGKNGIEQKLRMKYEYDEKGNWIKQMQYTELGERINSVPSAQFPGYKLVVREIKY